MLKPTEFLRPETPFHSNNKLVLLNGKPATVLDFWKWAYSMLDDNSLRGMVAQFIVAWAIGADNVPNDSWRSYDVLAPNGRKIEVKTTAFAQMWEYGEKNRVRRFVLKPTKAYSRKHGLSDKRTFNADIYVLCYYSWKDNKTMHTKNIDHWEFWVFTVTQLIRILDDRKSVSVEKLKAMGYKPIDALKLKDTIMSL